MKKTWNDVINHYAQACQIGYYAARADVFERRAMNGDAEAWRWFDRFIAGERLAWNDKA